MATRSTIITATTTVAVAAAAAAALAATGSGPTSADAPEKPEKPPVAARQAPAPVAHDGATAPKGGKDATGAGGAESGGDERGRGGEEGGGGRGGEGGGSGEGRGDEGGEGRGGDRGDDEDGGGGRGGGDDEGRGHGGGHGGGHHRVGRIHFNERTYPAFPDGCITAASGLGSTSFNIFNESRMTVEVFSGATCDNGGPIATVGPYGDTSGVIPQHVQGGVSVFNGVGASFRVVRHGHGGGWGDDGGDDGDY
ncbi:hypothetical protein ACF1FX_24980 [Streptomyces sp. NPDC014646]|uniref:hypothetical protein n=1 Tax=Streptomyces sp. NPDC014646 TaxID=3364877 RepID=UPI0036FDDF5D